jgi:hypothetical protein
MNDNISTLIEDFNKIKNDVKTLQSQIEINDKMGFILSDDGFKKYVYSNFLPLLNKFVTENLKFFDFSINFYLDSNLNEHFYERVGEYISFSTFSNGEKQIIELAFLFALQRFLEEIYNFSCNYQFFDELFDPYIPVDYSHIMDIEDNPNHMKTIDDVENSPDFDSISMRSRKENRYSSGNYSEGDKVFHANRILSLSEGDVLKASCSLAMTEQNQHHHDILIDQDFKRIHDLLSSSQILKNNYRDFFHHHHLVKNVILTGDWYPHILTLDSWVVAYEALNDPEIRFLLTPRSEMKFTVSRGREKDKEANNSSDLLYPSMALPIRTSSFFRQTNLKFQMQLLTSRGEFDNTVYVIVGVPMSV